MKNLLFVFAFFAITSTFAQEGIKWMTMNEAVAAQKVKPKKIFMDVYTTWCGPCKLLDKNTFGDKNVIEFVNANYYAVKFNAESNEVIDFQDFSYTNPGYVEGRQGRNSQHLFANAMKINSYPSVVFFKENGDFIQALVGYRTPQQIEIFLKMMANDDYINLTTTEAWEKYQSEFKGTF